jgi:hypothetical protein
MKWLPPALVAASMLLGTAAPCLAGQVRLEIRNGLVTLETKDATIREIFVEWARVGQTRVANAERMAGVPMTLQLQDVPERQALEIILRSAAGYVAAPRTVQQASLSVFDRIVLMPGARPASVPTQSSMPTPSPTQSSFGRGDRFLAPQPQGANDDDEPQPMPQRPMPSTSRPGMPSNPPTSLPSGASAPDASSGSQSQSSSAISPMPQSATRPGMPTPPAPPIK